ncbi:MAG: hypothetical protein LQ343_006328 [Gyalolechia ehrenbergii]|nr:MAG: hypothetical protein LQ343_006328 [Gyalolechia ehrenbergii]
MLLPALLYKQNTDDSAGNCGADKETLGRKAVFLDESKEQISAKFLSHVKTTISSADNSDLNDLVGPTLRLASAMIRDRNDKLLAQTVDLYALTRIITNDPDDWKYFLYPTNTHAEDAEQSSTTPDAFTDPRRLPPESGKYMAAQIKAAAEHRASTISKNVMIDLERRLERKERCQGFETTLVGILLLNCVERMCWAFQRVKNEMTPQDWPLENSYEYYLDQAASFAEFLAKLYKMRGVLLQLHPMSEDGILHTSPSIAPLADHWLRELRLTSKSTPIPPR